MRGIHKNSLLGRFLSTFKHPLILEYLASDTFISYIDELKDEYWNFFKFNYPVRSYIKAWKITETTDGMEYEWYNHFRAIITWRGGVELFTSGEDGWKKECLVHRHNYAVALLNQKSRQLNVMESMWRNWTKDERIKTIRKRTMPTVLDIKEYDDVGNHWVAHRPIAHEIRALKEHQQYILREPIGDERYGQMVRNPVEEENTSTHITIDDFHQWDKVEWMIHSLLFKEACLKWFKKTPRVLMTKVWRHFVFEFLDREGISLATKAAGPFATLKDYTDVMANKEGYAEIAEIAPGLTPFITTFYIRPRMGQRLFPTIREELKNHGITRSGWKHLINMPVGVAQDMVRMHEGMVAAPYGDGDDANFQRRQITQRIVDMAMLLAEINEKPRLTIYRLVYQSMERVARDVGGRRTNWVHMLRALFRATKKARVSRKWHMKQYGHEPGPQYWDDRIRYMCDYMRHLDDNIPLAREQLRMPWSGWERLARLWHENVQHMDFMKYYGDKRWESVIDAFTHEKCKGFKAVPLLTTEMLSKEGLALHHCVGGYVNQCANGYSRIFSIQKDGEQVSTLELSFDDGSQHPIGPDEKASEHAWRVAQHYRAWNKQTEVEERVFANLLAEAYTKEWRKAFKAETVGLPTGPKYGGGLNW